MRHATFHALLLALAGTATSVQTLRASAQTAPENAITPPRLLHENPVEYPEGSTPSEPVNVELELTIDAAGHVTVAATSCGPGCGRIVLVDWRSGVIQELAPQTANDEMQRTLPCRTEEALQFRLDSRLLSVTHARGTSIVTQYYVWNQKGAAPMRGVYQRTSQAFCAIAAG